MIDFLLFSSSYFNAVFGNKNLAEQPTGQQDQKLKTGIARGLVCKRSVPWGRAMARENSAWAGETGSLVACKNHCKIILWKLLSWCPIKLSNICFFVHTFSPALLICHQQTTFLFAEAPLGQYLGCMPIGSQGPTAWRRIGKVEVNEINSLVAVRILLQKKRAYYFLKPFCKLNAILQYSEKQRMWGSDEN